MPTISTNPASGSKENPSPKPPFPFSPDSYCLPKSITSSSNPESPLLPTNSPTFLVSGSDFKPTFKVPTSPVSKDTRDGINSYVEWMEGQDEDHESEVLIIFPSYHDSGLKKIGHCEEDLELLAAESTDDLYSSEESAASETETDSNASSRSSSPSLEGEEFDEFDAKICDSWSNFSCATLSYTTPPFIFAEDDISLHASSQPAHCVDFLAHEWETDDLWATYKHVHSHRDDLRASKRLENVLWRVWWRKSKGLTRVHPEVIHWLRESDIIWLYGPFQPALSTESNVVSHHSLSPQTRSQKQPQNSKSSPTKSLLKKRNPAKILQQRSEYTFSLLCEATGFRLPSPLPSPNLEPQSSFLNFGAGGLKRKEKEGTGKRVVFNEIVILYREVVEDSDDDDSEREMESEDYFRDFDEGFEGIDYN